MRGNNPLPLKTERDEPVHLTVKVGFVVKNKLLTYAIGISVVVHLVGVCVVARTSASRLKAAPQRPPQQRMVNVDLVRTPDEAAEPKPVTPKFTPGSTPEPRDLSSFTPEPYERVPHSSRPTPQAPRNLRSHNNTSQPAGDPGGGLNTGTGSANGDLRGSLSTGTTHVGGVPGRDNGRGQGSGFGVGIGAPDPPRHADDGPGTRPAPRPDPTPPPPRMVSVRVCNESGLLPNTYCDHTHSESFVEGREPSRTCERCKAPAPPKPAPESVHVSRLADRAVPLLTKNVDPSIPPSVPEGKHLTVVVDFTVTKDGDVSDVSVSKSSGYRALDNNAVNAKSRCKYRPAVQDGVPRPYKMSKTYEFDP